MQAQRSHQWFNTAMLFIVLAYVLSRYNPKFALLMALTGLVAAAYSLYQKVSEDDETGADPESSASHGTEDDPA